MSSVGRNLPHDSARGHVSGESIYIDDIAPSRGELIVDFLFSPVAHGRIRSIDLTNVKDALLFTYRDLAHNVFGPIIQDEILLAEEEVTFIGQPIVVIAAETRDAIKQAKAAITIDIEPLAPVFTIDEAKKRGDFIGPVRHIKRGDLDAAFAAAEHIIEGRWINGGQDHFYLESQAAMVYPGEYDQLTVHSSTQNPSEVQDVIAHLLGLPINKVVVITKRMGGGFGGKECQATHPAAIASLVAHKTKRPARIVYNKDDDMRITGGRHPFQNDYKVAFKGDGTITGLRADLYSDGGAYNDLSTSVMGRAMTHTDNAYYLPAVWISGTVCRTNYPPNTAFRGFGGPQGVITIENIMEEIAAYLGLDPFDVRRRNLYGFEERNVTPYRQVVRNNMLHKLFDDIETRADYRKRAADVKTFNASSPTHLRGIACSAVKFGISFNTKFLNQANALVNVYLDGSVQVSTGATEMGQGVNTKIKQLVADQFAIDPERVIVMSTSTEKNNNTSATAASSAADLNGGAAVDACQKIRERLVEVAVDYFSRVGQAILPVPNTGNDNKDRQDCLSSIVFENGCVFDKRNPDTRVEWQGLVKMAYLSRVSLGERGFYATKGLDWDADTGCGTPFLYFTQGVAVSEVEIDRFTGHMRIVRADLLMDIGKSINPGIDRGQITGAFVQGVGWLTNEEMRYSAAGELLSHSPTTYKIPNIGDLPEVFNVDTIVNEGNVLNVAASKAVGEPPLLLGISVYCAVKNALGAVCGDEIPKINAPTTGEEILMRLTHYANVTESAALSEVAR
jgi:xanthine dehydrogenase large subunit